MRSRKFNNLYCGPLIEPHSYDDIAKSRSHNESIVHSSMRFLMEQRQLEQRLRLDLPTLGDPAVRDLLHESDLFVRSFMGLGFGFGLFSPLDLMRVMSSITELAGQLFVLYTASGLSGTSITSLLSFRPVERTPSPQLFLIGLLFLPSVLSLLASFIPSLPFSPLANGNITSDALYTPADAREAERAERMRSMAHGEPFRAEVILFGLAPWIVGSWSSARKRILGLENQTSDLSSSLGIWSALRWLLSQSNVSEIVILFQNVGKLVRTFFSTLPDGLLNKS